MRGGWPSAGAGAGSGATSPPASVRAVPVNTPAERCAGRGAAGPSSAPAMRARSKSSPTFSFGAGLPLTTCCAQSPLGFTRTLQTSWLLSISAHIRVPWAPFLNRADLLQRGSPPSGGGQQKEAGHVDIKAFNNAPKQAQASTECQRTWPLFSPPA